MRHGSLSAGRLRADGLRRVTAAHGRQFGCPERFDPKQIAKSDIDRVCRRASRGDVRQRAGAGRKALSAQSARVEKGRPCQPREGAGQSARSAHRLAASGSRRPQRHRRDPAGVAGRFRRRPGGRIHRRHGRHAERGVRGKDGVFHARRSECAEALQQRAQPRNRRLETRQCPRCPRRAAVAEQRDGAGRAAGQSQLRARIRQDDRQSRHLSALLADKGHRIIARVVQNLATAVFLPVRGL